MVATATISTWAIQAEDAPASVGRLLASILLHEGVADKADGSFAVAEDTGSNMQIKVGSGTLGDLAAVAGDAATGQGIYVCRHQDPTVTLPIAASDPGDDRIDLVVLRLYDDDADSSGNSYADVEVVEGTPAASPTVPATPDSAIPLAQIDVGAGVTAITDSDITDSRTELDLGSGWQDYTPILTSLTLGGGSVSARYRQVGRSVEVWFLFVLGAGSAVAGNARFSLPVAAASRYTNLVSPLGIAEYGDTSTNRYSGMVVWGTGDEAYLTYHNTSGAAAVVGFLSATLPFTWASTDRIECRLGYEVA